jgi:hypothetical protein
VNRRAAARPLTSKHLALGSFKPLKTIRFSSAPRACESGWRSQPEPVLVTYLWVKHR